jgi:hypothetical protein
MHRPEDLKRRVNKAQNRQRANRGGLTVWGQNTKASFFSPLHPFSLFDAQYHIPNLWDAMNLKFQ